MCSVEEGDGGVRGSQPGVQGNKSNFPGTTCADGGLGVYFSGSFPFTVS